jgi:hypothetical protein
LAATAELRAKTYLKVSPVGEPRMIPRLGPEFCCPVLCTAKAAGKDRKKMANIVAVDFFIIPSFLFKTVDSKGHEEIKQIVGVFGLKQGCGRGRSELEFKPVALDVPDDLQEKAGVEPNA